MTFAHPSRLWLLFVLLPIVALCLQSFWKRRRSIVAVGGGRAAMRGDGFVWSLLIMALVIVALAEPRWGNNASQALPPGRDLVLVIDVSRSMAAEDAIPNRMGVAVESACSIIEALATEPGDRVAVIGFAGVPVLRCGLTGNLGSAREVVRSFVPGSVSPGGSDLAAAIDLALDSFDDREHAQGRAIIVLTDGEDLSGGVMASLPRWTGSGVVIHAVTIGDAEDGHAIPTGEGATPLTYLGEPVQTRRRDTDLEAVTAASGGKIVPLGMSRADLGRIYRESLAPAEESWRSTIGARDHVLVERFPWFLGAALAVWLAGHLRGWFRGRARPVVSLLLVALSLGFARAEKPDELVASGVAHYVRGEFVEARIAFQRAQMQAPDDSIVAFNLAATYFQQGKYLYAEIEYRKALRGAEPALVPKIDFAMGNCKVMLHDPAEAIRWYDRSLEALRKLPPSPQFEADIQANRAFALKQLQQEAPPEKGGEQAGDSSNEKSKHPPGPSTQLPDPEASAPPGENTRGGEQEPSRGKGGAGGQETAGARRKPAAEQLADAVESIRRSKEARRVQDSPPLNADRPEKDW